jgi:hypothetical protein
MYKLRTFIEVQGSNILGRQVAVTLTPNVCGPSAWKLVHFTPRAHEILRWLLTFWKICDPPWIYLYKCEKENVVKLGAKVHIAYGLLSLTLDLPQITLVFPGALDLTSSYP